jgi:transcriptional regulator with XRE-family HTH domain
VINPNTKSLPTIKDLRTRLGYTQTQLAFKAGVSPTTIANWEQNRATPFLDQLRRLCAVLGVPIDGVALTPHEYLLRTHGVLYHLKAQHTLDDHVWIGRCIGVDPTEAALADPDNPYSNGILLKPMDESDPDTTSVVVPVTWGWKETGATPDEAIERLSNRITTALDRCYAGI